MEKTYKTKFHQIERKILTKFAHRNQKILRESELHSTSASVSFTKSIIDL